MADLSTLHILLTRPEAQLQPWVEQFSSLGAEVSAQAFLDIKPLSDPASEQAVRDILLQLDQYQKAIFVSQNAVSYGVEWIDQLWPQMPQGLSCFAVGASTANLLKESLQQVDASVEAPAEAMNSEALLALPALQAVADEKILIFRGRGGRTHLAEVLEQRGAQVDSCELYRRQIPDTINPDALQQFRESAKTPVSVVLSGETLENLCTYYQQQRPNDWPWLQQQTLVVPGQRVAAMAQAKYFQSIVVAENATYDSILEALNGSQK